MKKSELVTKVAENNGYSKKEVSIITDAVFDQIIEAIAAGEDVLITDFGTFKVKNKKERQARNPKTGETVVAKASKGIIFKPSKNMLEDINQ